MSAPDPAEQAVYNQVWGGSPNPPAGAPAQAPSDAFQLYQGATQQQNGFSSWWVWDLRSSVFKLAWDLLRFRPITDGASIAADFKANPTKPHGLYDYIVYLAYKANGGT